MKTGDYKKLSQAQNYFDFRFSAGLSIVDTQEKEIVGTFLNKIPINPIKISLDLGSGTGRFLNILLGYTKVKVISLDESSAMLGIVKKKFARYIKQKKLKTIVANSQKIPVKTDSVDLVTAFHLFKHLPDINPTLKETNRVLKKRGFLIFDCLNKYSLASFNLETCYVQDRNNLKQILKKNGFNIVKTKQLNFAGETIYKIIGIKLGRIFKFIDNFILILGIPVGTKIFVIAQKIK